MQGTLPTISVGASAGLRELTYVERFGECLAGMRGKHLLPFSNMPMLIELHLVEPGKRLFCRGLFIG